MNLKQFKKGRRIKMFRIKKDKPLEDLKDFGFYYNDNTGQYIIVLMNL